MSRPVVINARTYESIKEFARIESIKRGWSVSQYVEWCISQQMELTND